MSEKVKLVIEIPKEAKQAFDIANDLKGGFYDYGGIIGNAIKNGIPLDDVKAEIDKLTPWIYKSEVFGILDDIGKESEVKPNDNT